MLAMLINSAMSLQLRLHSTGQHACSSCKRYFSRSHVVAAAAAAAAAAAEAEAEAVGW